MLLQLPNWTIKSCKFVFLVPSGTFNIKLVDVAPVLHSASNSLRSSVSFRFVVMVTTPNVFIYQIWIRFNIKWLNKDVTFMRKPWYVVTMNFDRRISLWKVFRGFIRLRLLKLLFFFVNIFTVIFLFHPNKQMALQVNIHLFSIKIRWSGFR